MQAAFFVVGALLELVGIVLIAAPDLVPGAIRFASWSRSRWRRYANHARRLFGMSPRGTVYGVSAAAGIAMSGHVTAVVGTSAITTDDKIEYLIRRDRDSQNKVNDLERRVAGVEAASVRQLEALRTDLETHVADELAAAQADYKTARVLGTIALAIGLALTTLGNFA